MLLKYCFCLLKKAHNKILYISASKQWITPETMNQMWPYLLAGNKKNCLFLCSTKYWHPNTASKQVLQSNHFYLCYAYLKKGTPLFSTPCLVLQIGHKQVFLRFIKLDESQPEKNFFDAFQIMQSKPLYSVNMINC